MPERPFSDPNTPPTEAILEAACGAIFACHQILMALTSTFLHSWNFSKSSGWMLKVNDKQKALFFLVPLEGGFKLSMAIRETEREAFLLDSEMASLHEKLSMAKKFAEGYALQFEIMSKSDFDKVNPFIIKLISLRLNSKFS